MKDPVKISPGQLVTVTRVNRKLTDYIDKCKIQPYFITNRNEVVAVLLSVEDYRKLLIESEKG